MRKVIAIIFGLNLKPVIRCGVSRFETHNTGKKGWWQALQFIYQNWREFRRVKIESIRLKQEKGDHKFYEVITVSLRETELERGFVAVWHHHYFER